MIEKRVGHYLLIEKIGEGGMGVVYKAKDEKLDRIVAIKFLPPEFSKDKEIKARFLREAKALSILDHPNICVVHGIDETEDKRVYMIMNYYEGKTLKEKIEKKEIKTKEAINIFKQIAKGLLAAHKKGIVHRDIKPANIMISEEGLIKILDFGLAKFLGESKLTKERSIMGTVHYMSPEQIKGEKIDYRTDIWSLGVLMYEIITGTPPFKGEYEQAVIYSILNENPKKITAINKKVPAELEKIIMKCLEKDPEKRYKDIKALLKDLNNLSKIKKKREKRPYHTPILMLTILFLFIFGILRIIEKNKIKVNSSHNSSNSIAVLPFEDKSPLKNQSFFCDGMTEDIIIRLSKIKKLKVINILSVLRYKNVQKDIKRIGKELGVENILLGSIRKVGTKVKISVQLIKVSNKFSLWGDSFTFELKDVFKVQDKVAEKIAKALKYSILIKKREFNEPKNLEIYEYTLKTRSLINKYLLSRNEEDFKHSLKMLKRMEEIEPTNPKTYMWYAWCYQNHYEISLDKNDLKQVISNIKKAYKINPHIAETLVGMGWLYLLKKDYDRAFLFFSEAIKKEPNMPEILHTLGIFYHRLGLFRKSMFFSKKAYERNPFYIFTARILASSYEALGELEKARKIYKKSIDFFPKNYFTLFPYSLFLLKTNEIEKSRAVFFKIPENQKRAKEISQYKAILYALKGEKKLALTFNRSPEVYSILGMKKEAIKELKKMAGKDRKYSYLLLINNPFLNNLRSDPEFISILNTQRKKFEKLLKKYGSLSVPI